MKKKGKIQIIMIDTPICNFVEAYIQKQFSRFHMPGHKGANLPARDITEIDGADDLYHADGIILKSEENASALFGSRHTFYSTEGSSLCIRAMLYLAVVCAPPASFALPVLPRRRRILAARNAHKTFLYACALLDLDVIWLYPEAHSDSISNASPFFLSAPSIGTPLACSADSLCSCPVSPETLRHTLKHFSALPEEERPLAVFLTSPDYLGGLQDIASLSAVCHDFGLPLLVDNAHGAYLRFLSPSRHPLDLGADLCCDSAHKTLPALTGCAYLHVSRTALYPYETYARTALSLFGSTSPSYLLLQSLDWCNAYLTEDEPEKSNLGKSRSDRYYRKRLAQCTARREAVCLQLQQHGFFFREADPLRIVFHAAAMGCSGQTLADYLRRQQIEWEYADRDYVVLMVTPENTEQDWKRLEDLIANPITTKPTTISSAAMPISTTMIKSTPPALSIREAIFSRSETVPIENALGRICAAPAVSCPPAIPVAVSGERITEETLALCRYYGITSLQVVAEKA